MSRKYRHQGYQDSDRDDRQRERKPPPRQQLSAEERIQKKSLRHATAREANEVIRCHECGRNVHNFGEITVEAACPHCNAPLHCCRTCRGFDVAARWQCRATIEEPVGDKAKANRCGHYEPRLVLDTTGRRSDTPQGSGGPRSAFENLFKR
jgi:hypothetical protein